MFLIDKTIKANCEVRRSRRCCLVFTFLLRSSFHCFPTSNETILFRDNFCLCFLRSLQVSKHSKMPNIRVDYADKRSNVVASWICNDVHALLRDSDF
jgi:hypothetical protein